MENIGIDIGTTKTILRGRNNRLIHDPSGKRMIPTIFQLYEPIRKYGNYAKSLTKKDSLLTKRDFQYSLNKEYVMYLNYLNSLVKGAVTMVIPQNFEIHDIKRLKMIANKLNMNLQCIIDSTVGIGSYSMLNTNYKGNLLVIDFGHTKTECSYFNIQEDLNRLFYKQTIGGKTIDDLLLPLITSKLGKDENIENRKDQILNNLSVIKSILNTSDCIKTINVMGDYETIKVSKEEYMQLIAEFLKELKQYLQTIKNMINREPFRIEIVGANFNNLYVQEIFKEVFNEEKDIHFSCDLSEGVGTGAALIGAALISGIKGNRKLYSKKSIIKIDNKEIEVSEKEIEIPLKELTTLDESKEAEEIINIYQNDSIIYSINVKKESIQNKRPDQTFLSIKLNNLGLFDFDLFSYERESEDTLIIKKRPIPFGINDCIYFEEEIDSYIKEELLYKQMEAEFTEIVELRNQAENLILNFPSQLETLGLQNLEEQILNLEEEFYMLEESKSLNEEKEKFDKLLLKLEPLKFECQKKFNVCKDALRNLVDQIESRDLSVYTATVYEINSLKYRIKKELQMDFDLNKIQCPKKLFNEEMYLQEYERLIHKYEVELIDKQHHEEEELKRKEKVKKEKEQQKEKEKQKEENKQKEVKKKEVKEKGKPREEGIKKGKPKADK